MSVGWHGKTWTWWSLQLGVEQKYTYISVSVLIIGQMRYKILAAWILAKNPILCVPKWNKRSAIISCTNTPTWPLCADIDNKVFVLESFHSIIHEQLCWIITDWKLETNCLWLVQVKQQSAPPAAAGGLDSNTWTQRCWSFEDFGGP